MSDIFAGSAEGSRGEDKPRIKKPGFKSNKNQEKKEEVKKPESKIKNVKINNNKKTGKVVTVIYNGESRIYDNPEFTLEDIRRDMEKDFPQLTKSKTQMVFDEKTGVIIPWVGGKSAGGLK